MPQIRADPVRSNSGHNPFLDKTGETMDAIDLMGRGFIDFEGKRAFTVPNIVLEGQFGSNR